MSLMDNTNFGKVSTKANGSAPKQGSNKIIQSAFNVPRSADKVSAAPDKVPSASKDKIKLS